MLKALLDQNLVNKNFYFSRASKPMLVPSTLLYLCIGYSFASSIESFLEAGDVLLPVDPELSGCYFKFGRQSVLQNFGFQPGVDTVNPNKFKQLFWNSDLDQLAIPENHFFTSVIINVANQTAGPVKNEEIFAYLVHYNLMPLYILSYV